MFCNQSICFEVHWAFLYLIFSHSIINILCSVPSTRTGKVPGTLGAACDCEGLCKPRGLQKVLGSFAQAISGGAGGPPWCDFIQVWFPPLHWGYFCWRLVAVRRKSSRNPVAAYTTGSKVCLARNCSHLKFRRIWTWNVWTKTNPGRITMGRILDLEPDSEIVFVSSLTPPHNGKPRCKATKAKEDVVFKAGDGYSIGSRISQPRRSERIDFCWEIRGLNTTIVCYYKSVELVFALGCFDSWKAN